MPTWYVETTGNDTTGDGSSGNPYLTLAKAETSASDGDTINVGSGTFEAAVSHTLAKQIAYVGAGSGSTILRGNNSARVIYLNSTKTKSLTGFTIDGLSSGTVPGNLVEGSGVNQATTFTDCSFTNGKTISLKMNSGMNGVTCSNCTFTAISTATEVVKVTGGASGVTLDGCTITVPLGLVMNGVIYHSGLSTSGTITINNCNITVLSNYGPIRLISGGLSDVTITNNTITVGTNCTRNIIDLVDIQTTCNVSGNTINIPGALTTTLPIKCTSTVGTGPDCVYTIDDNLIETHNPDNYGILLGDEGGDINSKAGAFNGSYIRNNTLRFPPYWGEAMGIAHGIMMGGNTNIFYSGNTVYGAAYAFAAKGHGEAWTDGYGRNSTLINCQYALRMKGQSSIRFVNNIIYNDGSMAGTSFAITENGVGEDSDNAFLRNNLAIRDADKAYEFLDTSFATADIDYQGYYLTGTATMGSTFPAASYGTLAEWQTGTGYDDNSISGNPNIKADYTTDASSMYFEKGIPVVGVTDIDDTTGNNLITLSGAASFSLYSPYKKRAQV